MARSSTSDKETPTAYGSAADLPSFRDLSDQIVAMKLLTRLVARDQRKALVDLEQQVDRMTRVIDGFYDLLGPRNWIFHDLLSLDKIGELLREAQTPEEAEARLIEIYRDDTSTKWWIMRLGRHEGLRARMLQIERARLHYSAEQFDSCVLQLIAVMDGFVNDFQPVERRGLHARKPHELVAWDNVVGHHMGLTHVMRTFTKSIKRRNDHEVFDLYRHGIVHGSIPHFDNVVVATKAWNMLFAVADWATATEKAAQQPEPAPTLRETFTALARHGEYQRYKKSFTPMTVRQTDPEFGTSPSAQVASEFLDAWEHGRWAAVARHMPTTLRGTASDGQAALQAKRTFERNAIAGWEILTVFHDVPSAALVEANADVNSQPQKLEIRLVSVTADGKVTIPGRDDSHWELATWGPHTFLRGTR